jgi:hypothetical protein
MQLTKFLIGTAVVLATVTSPVAAKKKDKDEASAPKSSFNKDPYPSTYQPYASVPTAVTNVIVYDGEGAKFQNATVYFRDGKVEGIETGGAVKDGYTVIDGTGKWVTPGIIDIHYHLGDYQRSNRRGPP